MRGLVENVSEERAVDIVSDRDGRLGVGGMVDDVEDDNLDSRDMGMLVFWRLMVLLLARDPPSSSSHRCFILLAEGPEMRRALMKREGAVVASIRFLFMTMSS
jgi:hypothetical protein